MNSVLKGNFETKKQVRVEDKDSDDLETRFEKSALKRLGGSIAFVSRKRVNWDVKDKD
jgi:hypothetical protein